MASPGHPLLQLERDLSIEDLVRQVPLHLVLVRPELAGPAARTAIECFQRHLPGGRG